MNVKAWIIGGASAALVVAGGVFGAVAMQPAPVVVPTHTMTQSVPMTAPVVEVPTATPTVTVAPAPAIVSSPAPIASPTPPATKTATPTPTWAPGQAPKGTPITLHLVTDPNNGNYGKMEPEDPGSFCASRSGSTINGVPTCD